MRRRSLVLLAAITPFLGCGSDGSNPLQGSGGSSGASPNFAPPGIVEPNRPPRDPNRISNENAKQGDPSWQVTLGANNHEVEGFASRITLAPGQSFDVKINVSTAQKVRWAVFRTGWYGGAGGRRLDEGGPIMVSPQPACPHDPLTQRVECNWAVAFSWTVPMDAVGGVHLIKLTNDAGWQSLIPFVVYEGRPADVVANVNVTTWQAYNDWGGESLYTDASHTMPHGKAWQVSYERPFSEGYGAGRFPFWEQSMFRWLEALGYDVTYTTGVDFLNDPLLVQHAKVFLSTANDEYWPLTQRLAVEGARDNGVNLAFLGADQALWRIRLQPSPTTGADARVVAGYKLDQDSDPVVKSEGPIASTARYRDDPMARPENAIIGVMYNTWLLTPQPLVVKDAASWLFAGTGLSNGDTLPLMVSVETDMQWNDPAQPAAMSLLASSPLADGEGRPWSAHSTYYKAVSGAEVVGIGSIGWAEGLGLHADPRVALITRNVLNRLVRDGKKGGPDPMGAPWTTPAIKPSVTGAWAKSVSTVASGLAGPDGIAVAPDGTIYVADSPNHQIRQIVNGNMTVLAGDGVDGITNGPGATARFRYPAGLALGPDGTLYVADADNHVIRAIAPDAAHTVSTYTGMPTRSGGFAEGPGSTAQFDRPVAIAVGSAGELYVADMHNCRVRRVGTDPAHTVSTFAGAGIGWSDGPAASAQFNNLSALAIASDGTMYVLDTFNRAIRRIGTDSAHTVTTLVGGDQTLIGHVDGGGMTARMGPQAGLALVGGKLYVSDISSSTIRVLTCGNNAAGTMVATAAGSERVALEDGAGSVAAFATPMALGAAPDGSVVIADSGNGAVRRMVP
jgi:hypothetical protein